MQKTYGMNKKYNHRIHIFNIRSFNFFFKWRKLWFHIGFFFIPFNAFLCVRVATNIKKTTSISSKTCLSKIKHSLKISNKKDRVSFTSTMILKFLKELRKMRIHIDCCMWHLLNTKLLLLGIKPWVCQIYLAISIHFGNSVRMYRLLILFFAKVSGMILQSSYPSNKTVLLGGGLNGKVSIFFFVSGNCSSEGDFVFLLDESGSVSSSHFQTMKAFVRDFTAHFAIGPTANQFSVVVFNDRAREVFSLNRHSSLSDIQFAVMNISYSSGGTSIGKALEYARQFSFTSSRRARSDAAKALFLTKLNYWRTYTSQFSVLV